MPGWLRLRAYLSRRPWAPLDCAGVSPGLAAELGWSLPQRLEVEVEGLRLLLLALPDSCAEDGQLLLPAWLGLVLDVQDGVVARVARSPDPIQAEEAPGGPQASGGRLEIEGPLTNPLDPTMTPFFALARPELRETICRQLQRVGAWPLAGSVFACRILGQVCAFRVRPATEAGEAPEAVRSAALLVPAAMTVRQAIPGPSGSECPAAADAAAACLAAIEEAGAALQSAAVGGVHTLLFEGAPPARAMPAFLESLRARLGGGLAHLPLGELISDLPAGRARTRRCGEMLAGFIRTLGLDARSEEPRALVLWGLDGPALRGAQSWLAAALQPLASVAPTCAVLGLCTSRARVPAALRALLDDPGARVARRGLGFGGQPAEGGDGSAQGPAAAAAVVGCAAVLGQLQTCVLSYYMQYPMYRDMAIRQPPRVLLHGPPGTGKTHILHWLCAQLPPAVRKAWLHPGDVWARYLGESEARVRDAFASAAASGRESGAVLIIEGLDQLAPPRPTDGADGSGGMHDRLVATLLVCLDGVDAAGAAPDSPGLAVIASACTPADRLDARLTRPGRFDHWVALGAPDASSRLALLRHFARGAAAAAEEGACALPSDPSAEQERELVVESEGWSAGRLQLAALRARADLPHGRSSPDWSDILAGLRGVRGPAAGAPGRGEPAGPADAASDPTSSGQAERGDARVAGSGDLASHLLEVAAAVAVPSSDEDDL